MARLTKTIGKFGADERGGLSMLMLPMFLLLMFITGLSLDLIQHETYRADLQNALDRGNLAAASRTQTADRKKIVEEYVLRRGFTERGITDAPIYLEVVPTVAQGKSNIEARAFFDMDTAFARMSYAPGTESFLVPALSQATEGGEIEVSLVLDTSGSMARETAAGTTSKRLDVLKGAAKDFVTKLLTSEYKDRVSISLVPYSGGTNAGPFFDELISGAPDHNDSYCIEFTDQDFTYTGLPPKASRAQVPQFQYFRFEKDYGNDAEWGWCPSDGAGAVGAADTVGVGSGAAADTLGILPFSDSIADLHARIDAFHGHDGTGTQIGMKWGLALLDPTTQPIISRMASADGGNIVPARFADRPANFDATDVNKIIVLMTDGRIRFQNRPSEDALDTPEEREKWATPGNLLFGVRDTQTTLPSDQLRSQDELNRANQLLALCTAAKDAGVRVFTIGFDITATPAAQGQMESCASDSDYFDVEGDELSSAFDQIASVVLALRLTK